MARTPFKLKSGNNMRGSSFKMMGGSPLQKSYKEAYAGLSAERKAKQTEAEFTKAAKDWNVKKYGTTEPTKESKALVGQHKAAYVTGDKPEDKVSAKGAKAELESRQTTRKENYEKDQASIKRNAEMVEKGDATKVKDEKGVVKGVRLKNKSNKYITKSEERSDLGKLATRFKNLFRSDKKDKSVTHKITSVDNPDYAGNK